MENGTKQKEKSKKKISESLKGKNKGKIPWNKGLTKEADDRIKNYAKKISKGNTGKIRSQDVKNRISNTLTGRKISKEIIQKMSKALKGKNKGKIPWNKGKKMNKEYCRIHAEASLKSAHKNKNDFYRKDLGHRCRSKIEANFARFLKWLEVEYIYEYKTFILKDGRYYTPDFYLSQLDMYIELKGYMYRDSENRIKIFKESYPNIKFNLLMQNSKEWKSVEKYKDKVFNWEN